MHALPEGTVTFLLTDIEGSTRLWELYPDRMRAALERHDALIRAGVEAHGGEVVRSRGEGDSAFAVFQSPAAAVRAGGELQQLFARETWPPECPLRIRIGLNTGTAQLREGDYFGSPVNRCARIRALAAGGQTLVAALTHQLATEEAELAFRDLGLHRLKDLQQPERLFQLQVPGLPEEFPPLRSLGALLTNLPEQLTSFVGREEELRQGLALLEECRLLTVTAAGGAGKTRLALQLGAEVADQYADGVWLTELAAVTSPERVADRVAGVLGVRAEPERELADSLCHWIGEKQLLLLLDNCEHLVAACAELADRLLRRCPHIRILVTSRETLGIAGEQVLPLPSLEVPSLRLLKPIRPELVEVVTGYASVRLFAERARSVQPAFRITAQNAPAVVQCCFLLDGLPLAIELAAARVRLLTVEQISGRLDDMFRLLTGGSRAALPRQQTLRAAIDWSYDLLPEEERMLLRRLSVFTGGWDLEAAEAVVPDAGLHAYEVLDLLHGLVNKSLVVTGADTGGSQRYRLLEPIRQYAAERLEAAAEAAVVRKRHLDYFERLALEAEPRLAGAEQAGWLGRLEQEHANLSAAVEASLSRGEPEAAERALRFATALRRFWWVRGHLAEGRGLLERALAAAGAVTPRRRGPALTSAGYLAWAQGDYRAAERFHQQALSLYEQLGDAAGRAGALNNLAMVLEADGDSAGARRHLAQSVELYRELRLEPQLCRALANLGLMVTMQGEYAAAHPLLQESLELCRRVGDDYTTASVLFNLGEVAAREDRLEAAQNFHGEGFRLRLRLDDPQGSAASLDAMARLRSQEGAARQAVQLLAAAQALRGRIGATIAGHGLAEQQRHVARLRGELGAEEFDRLWSKGEALSPEERELLAIGSAG